jgi:hypothetical protein
MSSSSSSSLALRMVRFISNVAFVYIDLHIIAYLFGIPMSTARTFIKDETVNFIQKTSAFQLSYLQIQVIAVFAIICAMLLFATLLFVINVSEYKNNNLVTKDALIAGLKAQVSVLHLEMADKNDDIDRLKHVIANMIKNNKID